MGNPVSEIVEKLNTELLKEHSGDTDLFADLTETQSQLGLLFGDRPTCPFLRPLFLSRGKYDEISHAAEIVAEAEKRLTYAALENDDLLDRLNLTEPEKRLARIDPGYEEICASSRFDTFIAGDGFKFLEFNAETPAGVGDQTPLEKVLEKVPTIKDFLGKNPHWLPKPHQKLLQALYTCYREFGGKKHKPNIAIVDWDGVSTEAEFHILKDYFESLGFRTLVADPFELEYNGENLHADSFEIDIVYKRVLIHELLEKCEDTHPILKAYEDGNLCICNSFRVKIPHKKASFAILTDEKYADIFTDKQLEMIGKYVPWTRKVEETKTVFEGGEIDLMEFLRKHRERFLIKPNDDYGGKGIVLGWEVAEGVWEAALEEALGDSFVAQERAAVEKKEFPVFGEEVKLEKLLVDFDPFLFRNQVEGGMVRLSSSSLVNVTQGGGQTGLVVLENL